MDTTYFGRGLGVMVFKDSISGKILFKQYVKTTNQSTIFCRHKRSGSKRHSHSKHHL
jgi:hypothetical protein